MKFQFDLKKLLKDRGLSKKTIIKETGMRARLIGEILNNKKPSISLDQLNKICTCLNVHGVPYRELPGRLFTAGPSKLWQELANRKEVIICLGEHYQKEKTPTSRLVSRRDSTVADKITQELSGQKESPKVRRHYVCCHLMESYHRRDDPFEQDIERTKRIYQDVRTESSNEKTLILVGSQRTNYLLEHFVADLFGCKPFEIPKGLPEELPRVPFFIVYRKRDRKMPSCFGWGKNPFTKKDDTVHGIHYQNDRGKWTTCKWEEWKEKEQEGNKPDPRLIIEDAGIIITVDDDRNKSIQIAVFGFSGRATEAIGQQLIMNTDDFWPPYTRLRRRRVGIYICKFTLVERLDKIDGTILTRECKPIRLSERILKKYLK